MSNNKLSAHAAATAVLIAEEFKRAEDIQTYIAVLSTFLGGAICDPANVPDDNVLRERVKLSADQFHAATYRVLSQKEIIPRIREFRRVIDAQED